jgi:hypothetical protein
LASLPVGLTKPSNIPPTRTLALLAVALVATALTLAEPASPARAAAPKLLYHAVKRDSQGRLLAWYQPGRNAGYDHVIRLAWRYLERSVPHDRRWGTKLPVYLVSSVYDRNSGQGAYWQHNPASLYGQFVDSLVAWYPYSGDQQAVSVVRRMLDYQLAHGTSPAGWNWPQVPFATACAGDTYYGRCLAGMPRSFYGGIEPDKVGELGVGYAEFYELTGERKYLRAAIAAGDALASHVRPGDTKHTPWPFRVNARTGAVLRGEEYGGMVVSPVRLFDKLISLGAGNTARYAAARDVAWRWLLNNPLNPRSPAFHKWSGYFEDIPHAPGDLNQASATMTAWYLLAAPDPAALDPGWRAHVHDVIDWVRTFLGVGPYYGAWAIDEQRTVGKRLCCSDEGLGSTTSRWAAINALYAARTGDNEARENAARSLSYATYFADDQGRVVCCGDDFPSGYWWDDGYADYTRSFNWAMAALPGLAPSGQDHLLSSSSVVQGVSYAPHRIGYRTFDRQGTEVLRLSFRPGTVTGNGRALALRSELDGQGYTVTSMGGGDVLVRIRRDSTGDILIS